MNELNKILAENIRFYRKRAKLSQEVFAEKLGCHEHQVSDWETAKYKPRLDYLVDISKLLSCSIDELVSKDNYEAIK